jgi:ankyrin repeat protein
MKWPLLFLVGALLMLLTRTAAADAGDLYDAALTGHVDAVRNLVAAGADINDPGDLGTPLHAAAFRGDIEIASILIDKGADVNGAKQDQSGVRPLHVAARYNQPEFVKFLLGRAVIDPADVEGMTPLLFAVRAGYIAVATLLLDNGADVNAIGYRRHTPLHWAVLLGKRDLILLVLDHKPDMNAAAAYGETPLHLAALYAAPDVIELLVARGASLESKTGDGRTPLMVAQGRDSGRDEAVAMLRKLGATQ